MFTIKMSLSLNIVKLSSKGSKSFVMISHRACEQVIPFYNNLKMISLEQGKQILQNMYTIFNVVSNIVNLFWKGAYEARFLTHALRQMLDIPPPSVLIYHIKKGV